MRTWRSVGSFDIGCLRLQFVPCGNLHRNTKQAARGGLYWSLLVANGRVTFSVLSGRSWFAGHPLLSLPSSLRPLSLPPRASTVAAGLDEAPLPVPPVRCRHKRRCRGLTPASGVLARPAS